MRPTSRSLAGGGTRTGRSTSSARSSTCSCRLGGDTRAAFRFFDRAIGTTKIRPSEVVTDRAAVYPKVLDELVPAAWHRTDRYGNNRVEADHGQLKRRLRPMRGLKTDAGARVVTAGHAFVQNVRRGHYELAVDEPIQLRLAVAFAELAPAI
jgi:IS6 family transposase